MAEERFIIGQVGRVITKRQYGFVHVGDQHKYFLHVSAMKTGKLPPSGTRVRFLIAPAEKGENLPRAVNVEVL
jgi:hypothetical protein